MNQVLRALLITLVVAGFIGAGLWLLNRGSTGLRKPALAFFDVWWAGDPGTQALAKDFEGAASESAFDKLRANYKIRLGTYKGPGDVLSEAMDDDKGNIAIALGFEKGDATGHFRFIRETGGWKVQRFRLDIPRSASRDAPFANPERVSTRLLVLWAGGHWEVVWEMFSPDLRGELPARAFGAHTKTTLKAFGPFEKAVKTSLKEIDDTTVHATFDMLFDGKTHKAKINLIWTGGRWNASVFEIEGFE